jgi:hypothetical protein
MALKRPRSENRSSTPFMYLWTQCKGGKWLQLFKSNHIHKLEANDNSVQLFTYHSRAAPFLHGYGWKENIKSCRFLLLLCLWVDICDIQIVFVCLSINMSFCLYRQDEKDDRQKDILIDGQKKICMEIKYTYSQAQ